MAYKGYWVVCYKSVSNPAVVSEYAKLAATALEALGGRVIAAAKPAKTYEAGVDQCCRRRVREPGKGGRGV